MGGAARRRPETTRRRRPRMREPDARRALRANLTPMKRTAAIVTVRMGSTRLPGKSMADILGSPSLAWICRRLRRVGALDEVVVATTNLDADLVIRDWAVRAGVACYAGPAEDVLARTIGAAEFAGAERLVFINGDSPLTDPSVVTDALARHDIGNADYVSSLHGGGGYPDGFSVEVFSASALRQVSRVCTDSEAREHVTVPFYRFGSEFRLAFLKPDVAPPKGLHLSVDTLRDLTLIRDLFARLTPTHPHFGYRDVMSVLDQDRHLLKRACGNHG